MAFQSQIPVYQPRGETIAQLLMRQGDIAARGAERSGEIWGRVAENLGNIGAQAYSAHREQKDQEKRSELMDQAISTWDGNDPRQLYRGFMVAGMSAPEAIRMTQGITSMRDVGRGKEPDENDLKAVVGTIAAARKSFGDEKLAGMWQQQLPVLERFRSKFLPDVALSAEYTPEVGDFFDNLDAKFNGAKAPGLERLVTKDATGNETIQWVEPKVGQTFTSAAPPEKPGTRREAMDTTTKKLTFVTDAQIDAEPGRYQPVRSGVNVNLQTPGGGKPDPLKTVDPKWRTVIDRASLMMPGIRRPAFEAAIGRIAATGNMDELASVVRQAAVEGENVDVKNQVMGRDATVASLTDARSILLELKAKGVPTGWLSGNAEDLARRLGTTTNPELVALGNRLAGTLINYRRAATGVQFGDKEQAAYEKMFPNYRQTLPVNLALIDGLMREMKTYDRVYWERKLGKDGAKLVSALGDEAPPSDSTKSGPQVGERRMFNGKVGVWDGKGWVRQ